MTRDPQAERCDAPLFPQGKTIVLYDLAVGWSCEECGRPKMDRLFAGHYTPLRNPFATGRPPLRPEPRLTGCPACDEVITRHRCTGRPGIDEMAADGDEWTCPECDTTWRARIEIVVSEERSWETA